MANLPTSIYITHLEREGPCIKVWGQTDRSLPVAIEKALQQMTPQFEQGMYSPAIENFQVGIMCCAKFKDDLYYRARITNISYLTQGMVEVLFVDYGNRDVISCMNTRTMSGLQTGLISIPAQAKDFILANVTLRNWDLNSFEMICSELRYLEFQLVPVLEVGPYVIISLYSNKQDVAESLVERGLLLNIPIQIQQMTLQPLIARNTPPGLPVSPQQLPIQVASMPPKMAVASQPVPTPTLLTYKALPLDNESEHQIYVSYVSDGPCLFSVQLKKMEEQLKRLMTEINGMDLQPLEEYPLPGTVCLAQSSEDGYICRAVVTSMVDGQYKVFYVDFGNTEVLQFDKLFQIPFKYVIPKVMATRFALAGLENATVSIEMKCKFKEFVNNRPLFMRVKPAATKSALPLCELWDENNVKALDMIKQAALLSYPESAPLTRGLNQEIKVSFVYSCNRIFVQLKSKEQELQQLMNSLQQTCVSSPLFNINDLKTGVPCCAIFPDDGLWYRAEILQIDGDSFKVRYVDFGNEHFVTYVDLRVPLPEHITALRPQAIECCLNGYQNLEPDEQRDILLEELIFEQDLSMRVVEIQGNRALVDLYDKQHYNVASLLLEKIASATSMVSPLLIQDNHRIEHRKRSPPQTNQKEFRDKRPLRELNERNRDNRQENWRQNKFSRNGDDDWNEQPQAEKQDKPYKTSSRNSDPDWETNENPENRNFFHRNNKRFEDQRGRNFSSRDNNERSYKNEDDTWDNQNNFESRGNFQRGKRNDFKTRGGFERRDGFDNREDFEKRDGFEKKDSFERRDGPRKFNRNQSSQNNRKFDDNQRPNRNFNDNRNGDGGFARPRNPDYKRDGSEKSWSDTSERSWKKGPKSFDRPRNNNKFGGSHKGFSPSDSSNNTVQKTETWDSTAKDTNHTGDVHPVTYDYATDTDKFQYLLDLSGTNEIVSISWFYNPVNFYCQLDKYKDEFRRMMETIQSSYRNRQAGAANVGAPVIVPFSEDGALYRAEVISSQFNQYHVKYVDYGNVATVNQVYPIEKKYMSLPAQAIPCGLQGITTHGDNWPGPDTYSNYFDKENFNCKFISFVEDRYCVDLCHDEKNLSNLLIEASLAISIQPTDIDISLLVSQQMVVVLRNVVSLNDIAIETEPGVTVKASMHNLASATETYEDNLKEWIGHFVIMYVDNVLEDSLEVTLYDLTGQKLNILTPDEGAYDTVDPLCPLPIYSNKLRGWVSYANAESIYLQPVKFADTISQLLESLYEHYDAITEAEPVTPSAGEIYAVLSSDSNWYRASVIEVKDSEVIVTFVDYGNSETVPLTNLRELSPQFYQPHMLAVEIIIPGDKEQYLEQEITVSVAYGSVGWEGEVISDDITDPTTIAPELEKVEEVPVQENVVDSTIHQPVLPPQRQEEEVLAPSPQTGVSVIISHIDTPSEFYIQLSDAKESITLLQEQLQEQVPSLPDLENPTAGVLCAAPYSVCQQWFRAQVLDADDDITTVRFVDFGNTDVISNSNVHVKTLPSEMLSIEYHAKLCSLYVKPVGEEWSSTAIDNFETYTDVENISAEIVYQDEKTTYVELYADGKNVGEMLKQEGLAADLELEMESNSTGFISHLNSPSEFWIQLESSCPDLEWVADQLASAENYPALEDLTPGSLCAAVFPGDDSWYRARILSNTVAGLEVIFIDYGNSCSCNGLRELPEDLIMLPPLALKCSLQKPNGILQWSQAATEKFKEISADGATVFNVNILTPGETSIVQLTYGDQDVSMQLVPETRQCFITHVESLENFWVQFMDDNAKIDNMTAVMESAETWAEVNDADNGALVAALFEDGVWYRARILQKNDEGYDVLFVDYGNTAVVSSLRQLPEECAAIEPLSFNFKLEMLPRTKWGDTSTELFTNMTENGAAMFDTEIVSENNIRLYLNGTDVRSSLEIIKCTPSVSLQGSPKKAPSESVQQVIHTDDNEDVGENTKEMKSTEKVESPTKTSAIEQGSNNSSLSDENNTTESNAIINSTLENTVPKNPEGLNTEEVAATEKDVEETLKQTSPLGQKSTDSSSSNEDNTIEFNTTLINETEEIATENTEKSELMEITSLTQQSPEKTPILEEESKDFDLTSENGATDLTTTLVEKKSEIILPGKSEGLKADLVITESETVNNSHSLAKAIENDLQGIIDQAVDDSENKRTDDKNINIPQKEISESNEKLTKCPIVSKASGHVKEDPNIIEMTVTQLSKASEEISDKSEGVELNEPSLSKRTTETSEKVFDKSECDITNQEISERSPTELLADSNVKTGAEITEQLDCDKTVEVTKTEEQELCSENKVNVETSDTGHSPRKDNIPEKFPNDGTETVKRE